MTQKDEAFEIYFCDLRLKVQKQLLEFMGVKSPAELNWDAFSIVEIQKGKK